MNVRSMNGLAAVTLVMTAVLLSACKDADSGTGGQSTTGDSFQQRPVDGGRIGGGTGIEESALHSWPQNVPDRVFFDVDKATLKPEGRELLTKWIAFLNGRPAEQLVIEGHSDEHGTREYNLALGERRAEAVKEFLTVSGLSPSRIKTVSYGKERPAVIGSNDAAWSQNRRAVGILQ